MKQKLEVGLYGLLGGVLLLLVISFVMAVSFSVSVAYGVMYKGEEVAYEIAFPTIYDKHWIISSVLPKEVSFELIDISEALFWYYKRPGYCPVCGTKGDSFATIPVGRQILKDGSTNYFFSEADPNPDDIKKLLICPNCGNLFAAPEKEEQ